MAAREIPRPIITISSELAQEIFDKAIEFNFDYDVMYKANVGFNYEDVRTVEKEHKKILSYGPTATSTLLNVSVIEFPEIIEPTEM